MVVNTDHSTQQHAIVIVCIVAPSLCSLFVAMRIWTRIIRSSMSWDDYAGLATLLLTISYSVLIALGTNYGFGWHTADISPENLVLYSKWNWVSSYFYLATLFGYKFTILLLYLRLFGVNDKFRYSTWAVMFFVFAYLFSNLLTQIFGCSPIEGSWKDLPGHCINRPKAGLAYGSMNFISDLFIFVLPMRMVWGLRLSRRDRLGVMLVFMGGGIAFVVAAVRYGLMLHMLFSSDKIWYDGKNLLWMVLEVNTGLICSCTPAMRPFLDYLSFGAMMSRFRTHGASLGRWRDDDPMLRRKIESRRAFEVFDIREIEIKDPYTRRVEVVQGV